MTLEITSTDRYGITTREQFIVDTCEQMVLAELTILVGRAFDKFDCVQATGKIL